MSLPKYPAYKESGVTWLGDVPEHWDLKRLGSYFEERRQKVSDKDYPPLSVTKKGIVPQLATAAKTDDGDNRKKVLDGDYVINSRSDRKGSSGISLLDGSVSLINTVLKPRGLIYPFFIHNLLRSVPFQEEYYRFGKGIVADLWSTNYSEMSNIRLAMPSFQEQTLIAQFLDRETAKIDDLIAEQEKLITLLDEKRQAMISHAVTKGLNPDAPMKDSGVEWLGEVPDGYSVVQLGRICDQVSDGPHFSPEYLDEGVMFLSARNVKVDSWSLEDAKYISENDYLEFCKRVTPEINDILYTKGGTTGVARVVDLSEKFQVWVHIAVLKIKKKLANPYFVSYSLNSIGCYEQSQLFTRGATNNDLGLTRLIKIWFALPSYEEQLNIVSFLDQKTAQLDTLKTEAQRGIDLLKERRSALISAAVTGKIDVRHAVTEQVAI